MRYSLWRTSHFLFNYTGGVLYTDSYIRSLGINNFSISKTEDDMHKDLAACYENWSTPLEIASLTDMLFSKELFPAEYQNFLKETMLNCQTGTNGYQLLCWILQHE